MIRPRIALVVVVVALSTACRRDAPPRALDDAQAIAAARAALAPFRAALKQALEGAMAESPETAIEVCATRAAQLATEHSRSGAVVGRSSARLRNPANAPRPWLVPVIERLSQRPPGPDASELVTLDGGGRGYAEAIAVAPMCLTCHGTRLAPSIAAKLEARYPRDAARGYQAGDFRGVFWVELAPSR